jgi:hypothetical protein
MRSSTGLTLQPTYSPHFSSTAGYFRFISGPFLHETHPDKDVGDM